MATKSDLSLSKNQHQTFVDSRADSKYDNLNLNQNQKCFNPFHESSKSKIENNKFLEDKGKHLQTWNKSSPGSLANPFESFDYCEFQKEKEQKRWKKSDENDSSANSSTLSLHIAAYENCVETSNIDENVLNQKRFSSNSVSKFENGFEIPRQQEDGTKTPEIMLFKASQRLRNPRNNSNFGTPSSSMPSINRSSSFMSTSTTNIRARTPSKNTSTMSIRGGYDVAGEDIQKRLNSVQRRKHREVPPKPPQFLGYTMSGDEMKRYFGAKYLHGAGQFWAITEIIKFSPNNELTYREIHEIYYFLYEQILDEKTLRGIFNADSSKFARQIFADENELFKVRGSNPDFLVSLVNPERDYVPARIRDEERTRIMAKFGNA
uniref:Uncharacterized protein n=1 Tax=Panagrolaimus sp. ES5 TaxID=591445 RepID=A0AC34FLI6_9BILA